MGGLMTLKVLLCSQLFFFLFSRSKLRMCILRTQINSYFLGSQSLNNPIPKSFYSACTTMYKNLWKISEQTGQDMYVVPQLKTILLEVLNFNFNKKRKNFIETCIIFPIWYSYIHRTSQLHLACTNQNIFQLFSTFDPLSL